MTMFWVLALLLLLVALAILLVPLLRARAADDTAASRTASNLTVYRDQLAELDADLAAGTIDRAQWEAATADLQRGLIEDESAGEEVALGPPRRALGATIAIVALMPVTVLLVYLAVGNPNALNPVQAQASQASAPHQLSPEQIESMVARLAQRLDANPDDLEGWIMLARTYLALGKTGEAVGAFAKAEKRFPKDAQLLADYADSLALAQGRNFNGKPEELIMRALKADSNNVKALALAGTVEFEKRDFRRAADYWKRILPLLPPDSNMLESVRGNIKEAESLLGGAAVAQAAVPERKAGAPAAGAANGARVTGTVKLAAALKSGVGPEDIVFVLARPASGSRMPLAAVKIKGKELPYDFSFDDSMAMSPASKLSDFSEVVVAARISKTGNVMPESGDFEGLSKPVRPGTSGLVVEISKPIK